jgi:hypothetical protein
MNAITPSVSTTFDLPTQRSEAIATAPEEPLDALATKVFLYTIGYVVLFVTVAVLLVA